MPDTCGTVPTVASVLTRQRSRERARCASPAREGWPSTAQAHRKVPWSAQLGSWASTLCYLCTRSWSVDHTISDHITPDLLNEQASLQFWLQFMPQVGSRGWGHTVWDTSGSTEAKYPRHTHQTQSGSLGSSAALDPKLFGFVLFFRFRVGNWSMFLTFWVFFSRFSFLILKSGPTKHLMPTQICHRLHTPHQSTPLFHLPHSLQVPEGEEVEFETPLSSLNKGASWQMCQKKAGGLALANPCKFNYIWVVKTWPLAYIVLRKNR